MSSLGKDMFKKSMLPPLNSLNEELDQDNASFSERKTGPARQRKLHKYTPYPWQDYFEESIDVTIPDTSDISFFI
ncbi:unnamed protein product [Mucor hiemalis]